MARERKIKKVSLADQVYNAIRENIILEEWKPGFKIPTENELAVMYGVNRLTVRMALQKLSTLGLVETQAGEGSFVKEFSFHKYISEVSDLIVRPEMLEDVCEFRKIFELECIRLTIERATDEDFAQLEQAIQNYENVAKTFQNVDDEYVDRYVEEDLKFHYLICKTSKNSLYPLAYLAVREPIFQYLRSLFIQRRDNFIATGHTGVEGFIQSLETHKIITDAIKKRDFETCKKTYLQMIDYKVPI
jgi:GntR family transcriptional repressor for pyruvate dehydrogenase complex